MEYKNTYNNINNTREDTSLSPHPNPLPTGEGVSVDELCEAYTNGRGGNNNSPLAFFDSGVGGLTVFEKVKKLLPNENTLYFGDTKNMPYGEKTEDELIKFADNIFRFFEKNNAKAVVMACNTTSAVTYEKLKDKYSFKIYPIIQTVCKTLAKLKDVINLAVIATPATVNSHCYKKEIAKYNSQMNVSEIPAPNWVRIVEEHRINQPQSIQEVKDILDMAENADKIVLACTHYPYLMSILTKFMPKDKFIDPSIYFAKEIKADLEKSGLLNDKFEYEKFFVSSEPENFKIASELFYKLDKLPELVEL